MRKSDNIFFYVLIDFLLQLCFFALLIFCAVISRKSTAKQTKIEINKQEYLAYIATDKVIKGSGISNLSELTDELTRLVPLKEQNKKLAPLIDAVGVDKLAEIASRPGGVEEIKKMINVRPGKPDCKPSPAVEFIALEDAQTIQLSKSTNEFNTLMTQANIGLANIKHASLPTVVAALSKLEQPQECNYVLKLLEKSYDTRPRDALRVTGFHMWAKYDGPVAIPKTEEVTAENTTSKKRRSKVR
jgi:hypothetical protein